MSWMQTFSGKALDFDDLLVGKDVPIFLEDVVTPLSRMPRFNGHQVPEFYSVAEHELLVHRDVRELGGNCETTLWALFHDAHETVEGDVIRPVKEIVGHLLKPVEEAFDQMLFRKMKLDASKIDFDLVEYADNRVLALERNHVMRECERAWTPLPDPPLWGSSAFRFMQPLDARVLLLFEIDLWSSRVGANILW